MAADFTLFSTAPAGGRRREVVGTRTEAAALSHAPSQTDADYDLKFKSSLQLSSVPGPPAGGRRRD